MLETSPRLFTRIAGLLWLIVIVTGSASMFVIHTPPLVSGDAAATFQAILNGAKVYRIELTIDLISSAAYAGVTMIFYLLLRPANGFVAAVAAGFGMVGVVIGLTNCAAHYGPLVLMTNASQFGAFSPGQLQALAYAFIKIQNLALTIAMVFFGLQCFFNGTVVLRAGYFPWFLGVPLMAAGLAYLVNCVGSIWSPPLARALFPVMAAAGFLGEGAMTLWLILVGIDREKWLAATKPV